jgi:ABC-type nickel/cobalt efflux system permease component RcnA
MAAKESILGFAVSSVLEIASIPLSQVNAVLQLVSLLLGIAVATITLYHAFRHQDIKSIVARLESLEERLAMRTAERDSRSNPE